MAKICLKINGKKADISSVWVYMEPVEAIPSTRYTLQIPINDVPPIFDPHGTKPTDEPWPSFIQSNVEEAGTFLLGRYFKFAAKKLKNKKLHYEWVVTSLDGIEENNDYLFLEGHAEKLIA